ncbi:MAG TPA: circadian clock KaiB family protein [Syntrophales bacterium]|nr:circadian clock KaiB family protein [Syntrophales bacterium]
MPAIKDSKKKFEKALREPGVARDGKYVLRLYITGMTPRSTKAIANIKKICDEHLKDKYELDVIDIYQQPKLASGEQIVATPTLIKKLPLPLRRLIGDMSDKESVLFGIDLRPEK